MKWDQLKTPPTNWPKKPKLDSGEKIPQWVFIPHLFFLGVIFGALIERFGGPYDWVLIITTAVVTIVASYALYSHWRSKPP
jgi:hypothetical protein